MSPKEYLYYLEQDKKVLGEYCCQSIRPSNPYIIDKEIGRFQYLLRTCEYLFSQQSRNPLFLVKKYFYARLFKKQSILLGFTIPVGVFGPGLKIVHRGTIVVNGKCRVGKNCTINAGVNIGIKAGCPDDVPIIGDNVYIGPGAKIFGKIKIADGCAIGANAVVCKDILVPNAIVIGIPAQIKGTVCRDLSV